MNDTGALQRPPSLNNSTNEQPLPASVDKTKRIDGTLPDGPPSKKPRRTSMIYQHYATNQAVNSNFAQRGYQLPYQPRPKGPPPSGTPMIPYTSLLPPTAPVLQPPLPRCPPPPKSPTPPLPSGTPPARSQPPHPFSQPSSRSPTPTSHPHSLRQLQGTSKTQISLS